MKTAFIKTWRGPLFDNSEIKIGILMNSVYCLHNGKGQKNVHILKYVLIQ